MANRQLRFVPQTVADVPFRVLENAFWRPQAAKLDQRFRKGLQANSDDEAVKTIEKLMVAWRREETWVNHSFKRLLNALPEAVLSDALAKCMGGVVLNQPRVEKLDSAGMGPVTGAQTSS